MRNTRRSAVATGLLALASCASAQVASVCPTTNVCFKLNIPDATASAGNGDIFFQLSAPDTYEYVALGQGSGMSGSNIFVVYTAGNGNVTISPRLGTGHSEPNFNSNAKVTLLEGSGVSGGKMVANVKCESCSSWSGGTADFTSGSGNWIYAMQTSGGPKDSTDQSASISQHGPAAAFSWSYANAKGGNSVNPLVNSSPSGTGTGAGAGASATSCVPRSGSAASASATGTATATSTRSGDDNDDATSTGHRPSGATASPTGGHHYGPPDDNKRSEKRDNINYCDENSNNNAGFTPLTAVNGASQETKILIAHGVLAALAFVIFFPVGAIAIRIASFPGLIWFHAAFQVLAYLLYIAAFGCGVWLANELDVIDEFHPIFGIAIFVCLFFQPIFGWLHHALFKKYQTRTFWSYIHIWLGRALITAGIVNGGLGFKLADRFGMGSKSGMIAYSVIAAIIWVVWVVASVIGERRRSKGRANAPPKYSESPAGEMSPVPAQTRGDIPHPEHGHYAPR